MSKKWVLVSLTLALLTSGCSEAGSTVLKSETSNAPENNEVSVFEDNPNPVSLAALNKLDISGSNLVLKNKVGTTNTYTKYEITYQANEFEISGILNIPFGDGPFPALVMGHGYIDPAIYTTGRGLKREQDYLASNGFIVLHTDYRNHAGSDDDPNNTLNMRLGYTVDVIAAAKALRNSGLAQVDQKRIGYLGRSMGGGIGYNVATVAPNEFDALVLYAPVSANYVDNFNKWGRNNPEIENPIVEKFGSPEDAPDFWKGISAENYFANISDPIMIHHGTNDESCKVEWSQRAAAQMKAAGKDVTLHLYQGEAHAFGPMWELSMQRSVEFLQANL
jgi:dipeptidyl aminopeptidase/acylaminoacyl peptidase